MTSGEAVKNELKFSIPSEYFCKKPSSNEKISCTLILLINHDGDSLNCGQYVSDVFDTSTGIWWQYDYDNITQISDIPKEVYYREIHKHMEKSKRKLWQDQHMYCLLFISEQAI